MNKNISSYIGLFFAMFLAGSSVVVGKLIVDSVPVYLSQVITLGIALVVIFPIAYVKEGSIFKANIQKAHLKFLFLQSLFGMFLFRVLLLNGLLYTTAIDSGIITSTGPAILAVLSVFMLKEKIKGRVWVGILVCVVGIILINISLKGFDGSYTFMRIFGNALVFTAVIGECLMSIFRKKMSNSDKPITNTMLIIFFALILLLPMLFVEYLQNGVPKMHLSDFLPLAYYGVFCTVIAYLLWFKSVPNLPMPVVSGFIGIMPVSSVILSVVLLNEQLLKKHIIGVALVLLGIYIIAFANNENKLRRIRRTAWVENIFIIRFFK